MNDIIIKLDEMNITEIIGIVSNCFRWLGWQIIKILGVIVNGMENAVTKIYNLNGFFNSTEVNELIDKYKPLIWVILAISIALLGIKIIFNRKQNRGELPSNLIFSIVILLLLPTLMIKLNDITSIAVKGVSSSYTSSANELVKNSIYDLQYLDSVNYNLTGEKNKIPSDKIFRIDENEVVDIDKIDNKKVMENKVVIDESGTLEIEKLEKGWFKIDEEYYRYSMDFASIIVSLGAMAITLLCVALKVARLLFELAFNKLFATLFAFADIDDGKRLKEIVKHIFSMFAVIFSTAVMTKLYVIFTSWLGSNLGNAGLNSDGIAKIVVLLGASIAVIDGPNIIEKILGMDAGLKSGWSAVMAGYGAGKGTSNVVKGLFSGGKQAAKIASVGIAGVSGAMKGGFGNTVSENKSKDDNNKENSNDMNKPLQEEMKDSKSSNDNGSNIGSLNNKDGNGKEDIQFESNGNISNEEGKSTGDNINSDIKKPTLQEEMKDEKPNSNNISDIGLRNNKFNNSEDENTSSNIAIELGNDQLRNNQEPNNTTLDEDIKVGRTSGNTNANPLQEEMKNKNINSNNIDPKNDNKTSASEQVRNADLNNNSNRNSNSSSDATKDMNNIGNGNRKNTNGNMEDRDIGQFIKDGFKNSKFTDDISRSYNLGKNTTSKWNIRNKDKSKGGRS